MTQLEYAKKQLELANNILQSCLNGSAGNEESIELARKLYDSCKKSVEICESNTELFNVEYDNLEDF